MPERILLYPFPHCVLLRRTCTCLTFTNFIYVRPPQGGGYRGGYNNRGGYHGHRGGYDGEGGGGGGYQNNYRGGS